MNTLFVSIKVDREERPDIDHLYLSALHGRGEQVLGEQGHDGCGMLVSG
jgi:uncharacterized protein YyaL (SSP411 family)